MAKNTVVACDVCGSEFGVDRAHTRQKRCSDECRRASKASRALARYYADHDRQKARARDGMARHRAANPRAQKATQIRSAYGITLDKYDEMLEAQGGVCAICGQPCRTGRALAVDHDHTTGDVRSLLCANCNNGLGRFGDDPSLLRIAADYLEAHRG